MTYGQKLEQIRELSLQKLNSYSSYVTELKNLMKEGIFLTPEQIKEQDMKMSEYHLITTRYSELLEYIHANGILLSLEYKSDLMF